MKMEVVKLKTLDAQSPTAAKSAVEANLTKLHTDAIIWALRLLRLAQTRDPGLDEPNFLGDASVNERMLQVLQNALRPLYDATPRFALGEFIDDLEGIEAGFARMKPIQCSTDISIATLAERVGLSEVECDLLRFKAAVAREEFLGWVTRSHFSHVSLRESLETFAVLLQSNYATISAALSNSGFFTRAGLLRLDPDIPDDGNCALARRIELRPGFLQLLDTAAGDFNRLLSYSTRPVPENGVPLRSFEHLQTACTLILGYLQGSVQGRHAGANILLKGDPGIGKTELARALVRTIGATGLEVIANNDEHTMLNPLQRRLRYQMAAELLRNAENVVLIFDDADGSLGNDNPFGRDMDMASGAALNEMLDHNPVPTIWIINDSFGMSKATQRRFDVTLEVTRPPASVVFEQLQAGLADSGVSSNWSKRVSQIDGVTPAVVSRLERISKRLPPDTDLEKALEQSLKFSGFTVPKREEVEFERAYCNTRPGIDTVCNFLLRSDASRLLLHGPTGTGKTALAKHFARSLDLSPRLIRPSDLLGRFLGETEGNIASLFKNSDPRSELIVLDEFESMSGDRRGARHNWELSQVNELLGQMDEYRGRVVACTNLLDRVDHAIRRRFQLKVLVGALERDACLQLVQMFADRIGVRLPARAEDRIQQWDGLSYGHVKNAAEVAAYSTSMDGKKFLDLVEMELQDTSGIRSKPIGFTA